MAFGTDKSVLFREVSLIQGVLIERFHYTYMYKCIDVVQVQVHTCIYTNFMNDVKAVYYNHIRF